MRALSVRQPWSWAILHAGKDVENRSTTWSYRGPLVIHAGKQLSEHGFERMPALLDTSLLPSYLSALDELAPGHVSMQGVYVGLVELVDCHEDTGNCCRDSIWAERSYIANDGRTVRNVTHLILERPRAFRHPIRARGRLGLWTPSPAEQEEIDLQVLTSKPGVTAHV